MKKITLFLLSLLLINWISLRADSLEVNGVVSGSWDVDTVNVMGNLLVQTNENLMIHPGTQVLFHGHYSLEVRGQINIAGTPDQPVHFMATDTTGFYLENAERGGWAGLRMISVNPNADSSIIAYCHFQYGKALGCDSLARSGGAIAIHRFNKIHIHHCTFTTNRAHFNGGALYLSHTEALIEHNTFSGNLAGTMEAPYGYGGGICADMSHAIIRNNHLNGNSATGLGGGIAMRFSDGPVQNNIVEDNFAMLGGGISVLHIRQTQYALSNNLITNNSCLYYGAGVSNNDASPTWINNTIVNNPSLMQGGGFYCKDAVCPNVYNTILWGNTAPAGGPQVYLWDVFSQANFYNCLIEGGKEAFMGSGSGAFSGAYDQILDTDPRFSPNVNTPYQLSENSPCRNAGKTDLSGLDCGTHDLAGNYRICHDTIDMGAYEFQSAAGILSTPAHTIHFKAFPNPCHNQLVITVELDRPQQIKARIIDLNGRVLDQFLERRFPSGKFEFTWNRAKSRLPNGIYYLQLQYGSHISTQKIILN